MKIGTFREKNFQRIITVFVAADLGTKRKRQNTNVQNPNTTMLPLALKHQPPNPKHRSQCGISYIGVLSVAFRADTVAAST